MEKVTEREVTVKLKSSVIFDKIGRFVGGGIRNSKKHVNSGIWIEIMDDPVLSPSDEWEVTGRIQMHLGGTRQAYEELGKFLLSLAHYHPPEPGYSAHFEWSDLQDNPILHMIIHLPVEDVSERTEFSKVYNFGTAVMDDNDELRETTSQSYRRKETKDS